MPRFTVKDLLITTTLIAIGTGMLWFLFHSPRYDGPNHRFNEGLVLYFASGTLIGAGCGIPFKRLGTGALVGAVLFLLVLLFIYSLPWGWG